MMTARKTPKTIADSVMYVRRRLRHRLRHAIVARLLPFIALQAVGLFLVLFIPELALWLPSLME